MLRPADAADALVPQLEAVVVRQLAQVVEPGRPVALVNFPNHGNPGDPAIWLGTRAALDRLGCRVAYTCSWASFDRRALQRALPDGPVLINGGGNFGDLYAGQQGLRERLLHELRGRRLVQLPQSIHFRDPRNLDRVRGLVESHGDVVLMVRERQSEKLARKSFDVPVVPCPDMAFALGPLRRPSRPDRDIIWLHRRPGDLEYVDHGPAPALPGLLEREWMETIADVQRAWDLRGRAALALNGQLTRRRRAAAGDALLRRTFEPLAVRWVEHGLRVLSQGRVVVTDKLHGHILSMLLGIPHVVLDNSYGKVRGTWDTWTSGARSTAFADSAESAARHARALLAADST